jgi:hypothetical protein
VPKTNPVSASWYIANLCSLTFSKGGVKLNHNNNVIIATTWHQGLERFLLHCKSYEYCAMKVWPQKMRCFKIKNLCFGWENKKGALPTKVTKYSCDNLQAVDFL